MKLTDEQFKALAPYQSNFETMVRSKWARHPGAAALDLIHKIHCQVTGSTQKLNKGCQHCIMRLLSDMGRIYLADLEERNMAVKKTLTATKKVDVAETETTNPVKVEVKTKRKYTRRNTSRK